MYGILPPLPYILMLFCLVLILFSLTFGMLSKSGQHFSAGVYLNLMYAPVWKNLC